MTDERTVRVDHQAASWLAEGPTTAPEHLLADALARASREPQRPALVARALGAPDGGRRTTLTRQAPLVWLAAALLILAGLEVTISIVGRVLESRVVVVVPMPSASPDLTARPIEPTPKPDRRLIFKSAGFAITVPSEWNVASADSQAVTLGTRWGLGPTWDMTYTLTMSITSANVTFDDALTAVLGGRAESTWTPVAISAGRAVFVPSTSLDPPPLVLIEHGDRVVTLAVRDLATPGAGGTALREMAASFEWLDQPTASPSSAPTPEALTNPYTDPSGFEVRYGHQYSHDDLTQVNPGLVSVTVVGTCSFDFCPLSAILSGGTLDEGPVVAFDPLRRVAGTSLDELEAAWVDLFGPLTRTPRSITVDGEFGRLLQSGDSAAAILVIHRDHAYAFVARPFLNFGLNTEFLNTVVVNFTFVEPS